MAITAYSEHDGRKRQDPAKNGEKSTWYPRISHNAARTAGRRPPSATVPATGKTAFEEGSVIGFKDVQAGVEQLALGNNDHVESRCEFVATENLSNQTFSSISYDRAAKLASRRDS
jgi:hypothetical protein